MDNMLGQTVRSTVTGFTGIVTAECRYLHSPVMLEVTATELHEGRPVSEWFYDSVLEFAD